MNVALDTSYKLCTKPHDLPLKYNSLIGQVFSFTCKRQITSKQISKRLSFADYVDEEGPCVAGAALCIAAGEQSPYLMRYRQHRQTVSGQCQEIPHQA